MRILSLVAIIAISLLGVRALTGGAPTPSRPALQQDETPPQETKAKRAKRKAQPAQEREDREEDEKGGETKTAEKSFPGVEVGQIEANVVIGKIRVFADSPDRVQIKAVRRAKGGTAEERRRWLEETRTEITQQGDRVTIKDIIPEDRREEKKREHSDFHPSLTIEIHLSARQALSATCVVGDVEASGAVGALKLNSTAGNVRAKGLRVEGKPVELHTTAGNVECEGRVGDLTVDSQAGEVHLRDLDCSGEHVKLRSAAGRVEATFRALPSRELDVDVATGEVRLTLPADARADLDLHTNFGEVHSDWNEATEKESGDFSHRLTGKINGGGSRVHVKVALGEARVLKAAH